MTNQIYSLESSNQVSIWWAVFVVRAKNGKLCHFYIYLHLSKDLKFLYVLLFPDHMDLFKAVCVCLCRYTQTPGCSRNAVWLCWVLITPAAYYVQANYSRKLLSRCVPAVLLCFSPLNQQLISSSVHYLCILLVSTNFSSLLYPSPPFPSPSSVPLSSPQGTVNNQTGIFPQSFVKIIKPLPESDTEGESEGPTYSCLRCFLLTPSGVTTR